jgi:hypothetical protein
MREHAGAQLMLKPWHIKALWFKAALQDVLLEGQKSLTAVQWQQMCSMWVHVPLYLHTNMHCTAYPFSAARSQSIGRLLQPTHCTLRCRYISRNDDSIALGDLASKVRRDEERRALADGTLQLLPRCA